MALDFPSTPSVNDTYTLGTKTWKWNGAGWQLEGSSKFIQIGDPVVGGHANTTSGNFLYVDSGNVVNQSNNLTIDPSTNLVFLTAGAKFDGQISQNIVDVANTANTFDLAQGIVFTKRITAAANLAFANVHSTRAVTFLIKMTNGGNSAITWPTAVRWGSGVAPTLVASGTDLLSFTTFDSGTTWYGTVMSSNT